MFSWLFVRILVRVAIRMSRKALWTLQSDPEFQCVSMPLPGEEFQTLEKAITSGRVREPVAVWHRIMIEGYPRYEIYTRHGIKFALEEMVFPSSTDAVLWACVRQLRRGLIVPAARPDLPAPTVKDMPAFDPDGPLMSLVLTIPSWVNVLENSGGRHSFSQASPVCREKLEQALYNLYAAAESALAALWEE